MPVSEADIALAHALLAAAEGKPLVGAPDPTTVFAAYAAAHPELTAAPVDVIAQVLAWGPTVLKLIQAYPALKADVDKLVTDGKAVYADALTLYAHAQAVITPPAPKPGSAPDA